MITFLFSVHTINEAKQYAGLGRAEPGLEQGRWIFQPGHLTWRALQCSAATVSVCMSVCQTRGLCQNEKNLCPHSYTT